MPRNKVSDLVKRQVCRRADHLCEYCHASEKWQYVQFTVDHVVPLDLRGTDDLENLALACFHCNRRKRNRIKGIDPEFGQEVELFNPRLSFWAKHFVWSENCLLIVGISPIGKATVAALNLNRERVINIRAADVEIGRHPPNGDPVQR
jgi:HNH endonuclease